MKLREMLPFRPALVGLTLLAYNARLGSSISMPIAYCSSQNTASGDERTDHYNSEGACSTYCRANYAFAVLQWQNCWCTNYIPADTVDTDSCNQSCPGFPSDVCGNQPQGLFGYIALNIAPSGTAGGTPSPTPVKPPTTPSSRTPTPPTTSYVSEVISVTVSVTPPPDTSIVVSTVIPSSHSSASTDASSETTPVVSTRVVYISGAPVTQTVTSTPLVVPNSGPETVTVQRKTGISGGAVAGIVLGVLFGVAAVVLAAFLLWRRRRSREDQQPADGNAAAGAGDGQRNNPRRNVSVLSKTGLLARARPSMGEREHDEQYYIPPLTGHNSIRQSMLLGLGGEATEASSPLGGSQDGDGRRTSKPFIYDQRLNPSALYASHDNGSRVSMQDNNDYSRPLGVANPDTRPSFESRNSH